MIFITGATGFVGQSLIKNLLNDNHKLRVSSRRKSVHIPSGVELFLTDDITDTTDWNQVLQGVDVVIHTVARVHVMDDSVVDPLSEFRKVNVDSTLNLARQAIIAKVKRFIFISSIKVNGEMTLKSQPFTADDEYIPTDPYGLSKYEAEQGLLALAESSDMEIVIIRPPLVYGPGVKANFSSMMKWIKKGIPLPFATLNNKRSLIAVDNLVNFITLCIKHPKAANEVFLVSDGEDVSISVLLRKIAKAFDQRLRLFAIPVSWMISALTLIGKGDVSTRLCSSLQIDSSKARDLLGWSPVITMDEQLQKTADAYLKNEKTL